MKIPVWNIAPVWWKPEYFNMNIDQLNKVGIYLEYIEYNPPKSSEQSNID